MKGFGVSSADVYTEIVLTDTPLLGPAALGPDGAAPKTSHSALIFGGSALDVATPAFSPIVSASASSGSALSSTQSALGFTEPALACTGPALRHTSCIKASPLLIADTVSVFENNAASMGAVDKAAKGADSVVVVPPTFQKRLSAKFSSVKVSQQELTLRNACIDSF